MSQTLVLEGTGAELIQHLEGHSEERFRLTALSESDALESKPLREKNWKMLEALEQIEKLNKEHPPTDGSDSLRLLHEARDGGMYDYDPNK